MFNMFLYYPLSLYSLFALFCVSRCQKIKEKKGLKWPLVNVTVELLLIKCGPWV